MENLLYKGPGKLCFSFMPKGPYSLQRGVMGETSVWGEKLNGEYYRSECWLGDHPAVGKVLGCWALF